MVVPELEVAARRNRGCGRHPQPVPGPLAHPQRPPRQHRGRTRGATDTQEQSNHRAGLVAFALFTAEGAAYDWSNLYLRDVIGGAPNVATLAFVAFSVGMIGARFVADRVVAHVGPTATTRRGLPPWAHWRAPPPQWIV